MAQLADARMLAWYESADGIKVLGPRGWYCEGMSGSSGAVLYLYPSPIDRDGPVIVFDLIHGESSGSFEIDEFIGRAFPAYRTLGRAIWESTFDTPYPVGAFPNDVLTYRSKTMAEFTTPVQTEGLGNLGSFLGNSDLPTVGAAILTIDTHDRKSVPDSWSCRSDFPGNWQG